MGLDISHDAFHGAYSSFNRLRVFMCKAIGGSYPPHEDKSLLPGKWYWNDELESSKYPGMFEFFSHSDCDGEIASDMAGKLADELEELMPKFEKLAASEEEFGHIAANGGYVETIRKFIAGCRKANESNEPLLFG